MRIEYTPEEKTRLGELLAAMKALDTRDDDFMSLHPYPTELNGEPVSFEVPAGIEESNRFWQQHAQLRKIWEETAPAGWWAERVRRERLEMEERRALSIRIDQIRSEAKDRAFASLGNDPSLIMKDAQAVIQEHIAEALDYYREQEALGGDREWASFDVLSLGSGAWKLNASVIKDILMGKNLPEFNGSPRTLPQSTGSPLSRHFKALEGMKDLTGAYYTDLLEAHIDDCLSKHPAVMWPVEGVDYGGPIRPPTTGLIRTTVPQVFISPTDKVTKYAFGGLLTSENQPLKMEPRKSRKQITTIARINFDAPQLQGIKGLTYYDRMVYDAITTLYINGKNEYITPQMIYQVMTGQPDNYATKGQESLINESITKFMYGGIYIDASQEAKDRKLPGKYTYDTNLLHAERMRQNLNGTITDCIRLIKAPVLYEYADEKNQIARIPVAALASPVRKTEDIMALQAYLLERVLAMRGSKTAERDISYQTIYDKLWGAEAAEASRMKKKRIREHAATILTYWCQTKGGDGAPLIKKVDEYMHGKSAGGLRVTL